MYRYLIKPLLAKICALLCILALWPLMALIAIFIKIDSPGKVLFIQQRIGKNGRKFSIYKFRSMKENAFFEGTGAYTYENDPRITRVGRFIRKTSLDELPQLFNIILGEMCFIGPRPLLTNIPMKYEDYPVEYKLRFSVLPGMFCSVDTKYRADASLDTQFRMDVEYSNNITFLKDVEIFLGTSRMVLLRKGVYRDLSDNEKSNTL